MRIALGSDHRGIELKRAIMSLLTELGHDYHDLGSYDAESVDYPDIAQKVARTVVSGNFDYAILICSTGIGMSIAANKIKGIRAALCHDILHAQRSRQHNDANILCLGGEFGEQDSKLEVVRAFLSTSFEGGRHSRRLDKIRAMEALSLDNK